MTRHFFMCAAPARIGYVGLRITALATAFPDS
ncbi:hypothetical protein H4W34_003850 [Actinomadura algeriensis]|uniref:Uncharacterized protein n=1 Tax=Actinomadura algeriensis TaxID=1679523 RepID=A0ABR9JTY2_9ACTN|nr:hypothetical protein [Actinomadura algeriensis]